MYTTAFVAHPGPGASATGPVMRAALAQLFGNVPVDRADRPMTFADPAASAPAPALAAAPGRTQAPMATGGVMAPAEQSAVWNGLLDGRGTLLRSAELDGWRFLLVDFFAKEGAATRRGTLKRRVLRYAAAGYSTK